MKGVVRPVVGLLETIITFLIAGIKPDTFKYKFT
jgi:hypothetical protein